MKINLAQTGLLFLLMGVPGCFPKEQPKEVSQQKPISFKPIGCPAIVFEVQDLTITRK